MAFVLFYIDQTIKAWTEPNASVLPLLHNETCSSCTSFEADAEEVVATKERLSSPSLITSQVLTTSGCTHWW